MLPNIYYFCDMKFYEFYINFPDESTCYQILKCIREAQGVVCNKCGSNDHYWKGDKNSFECKECNYRTSLRKGTVIEHSKLPLKYWLSTIAYMNNITDSISALELQKELGHKRYEPIWLMLKKIKNISKTDNYLYKISDYINMDENGIKLT